MRLSTYINAAVKASARAAVSNTWAEWAWDLQMHNKRQLRAFESRAIALADEQDQLIALQAAELDGFMRVMQEAHDG